MISVNSLVLYRNQPALVQEIAGGKFGIVYCTATPNGKPPQFATQKVRDKDILLLVERTDGSKSLLSQLLAQEPDGAAADERVGPLYQLLSEEEDAFSTPVPFATSATTTGQPRRRRYGGSTAR